MTDAECVALLQWACPRLGLRWPGFRRVRGQVCKRIARRMVELGMTPAAYRDLLERSPEEWPVLDTACRVTISRFYRDRAVWDALGAVHLPGLARRAVAEGRALRAWSAGCCSGEEPYTLALVLRLAVLPLVPATPAPTFEVLATDVNPVVLERARRGCYPPGTLAELPRAWRQQAFRADGAEMCLLPEHRAGITWCELDLRQRLADGPFDLILCRNLAFTYLAPEAQLPMLRALVERLHPDGLLVIGAHEALPEGAAEWLLRPGPPPIFVKR
jgi:chemotaxis protein methyltransferase CheR